MSVTVGVTVGGIAIPGDSALADVTIRSGRSRADDGLLPASCTVTFLTVSPGGAVLEIGAGIVIKINGTARFTGKVAEVTQTESLDGHAVSFTLVGIGNLAYLERGSITLPIAAETAAARASRIITAAGFTATIQGGTTYQLAAYGKTGDAPATWAEVLSDLMTDTGGVIADLGAGGILAQFPEARISGDTFTPDPAKTAANLEFVMTDDLVNEAIVTYAGGSLYTAQNTSSITRYGKRSTTLQTGLADVGSATRRAGSLVARLGIPMWRCDSAETWDEAIMSHGIGAMITLSPLPAGSAVAGNWVGVLEGWTARYLPLGDGSGLLGGIWDLSLSDQRHAAEALIWSQVTPTERWNTVNPVTRWQDAVSNANL